MKAATNGYNRASLLLELLAYHAASASLDELSTGILEKCLSITHPHRNDPQQAETEAIETCTCCNTNLGFPHGHL